MCYLVAVYSTLGICWPFLPLRLWDRSKRLSFNAGRRIRFGPERLLIESGFLRWFWNQISTVITLKLPALIVGILRIWCQSDNTVKEVRNQFSAKLMCVLCQTGVCSTGGCYHLPVGHTHEDVDGIFSLVTSYLRSAKDVQTPRDICKAVENSKLGRLFREKGMEFEIEIVDVVPGHKRLFCMDFITQACVWSAQRPFCVVVWRQS